MRGLTRRTLGGYAVSNIDKSGINLHHEEPFTEPACPHLVHLRIYIFPPPRLQEQNRYFVS